MIRLPSKEVDEAYLKCNPSCMFCGSNDGHSELLDTGDFTSLDGFELWFCCHSCRDANKPCETFHKL